MLVGKEPWAGRRAQSAAASSTVRARSTRENPSIWQTLGLTARATASEIKSAYKKRALEVHPDRGGSAEDFRVLQSAYESALQRRAKAARKPKAR